MSETEIKTFPPMNAWLIDESGLARWRPQMDSISVFRTGKQVVLRVDAQGSQTSVVLGEVEARHIGKLLIGAVE